jgi:hypothetical protein
MGAVRPRVLLSAAVLALLLAGPGRAEDPPWASDPAWRALVEEEVDVLRPLLRSALKEGYRRQARYLADRILAVDPRQRDAIEVRERWNATLLEEGSAPRERWARQRDEALAGLGARYAALAADLRSRGVLGAEPTALDVRAHHYGHWDDASLAKVADGHVWLSTLADEAGAPASPFLAPEKATSLLGARAGEVSFPPEHDDAFVRWRVRFPGLRVAALGEWRLLTDLPLERALPILPRLVDAEEFVVATMGSERNPEEPETVDVLVFSSLEAYVRLARPFVEERYPYLRERFDARSGIVVSVDRRVLASAEDREAPWLEPGVVLARVVAPFVAQRHLAPDASGGVQGRGAWFLDGFAGLVEGLKAGDYGARPDEPAVWRLAVARALHAEGHLLPWDAFFELDERAARDLPRRVVKVEVGGESREIARADVAAAQATAVAWAVWRADESKGPDWLRDLLVKLHVRDRLPDLEDTLRWRKGRLEKELEAVLAQGR